jgi:hypothetical protein
MCTSYEGVDACYTLACEGLQELLCRLFQAYASQDLVQRIAASRMFVTKSNASAIQLSLDFRSLLSADRTGNVAALLHLTVTCNSTECFRLDNHVSRRARTGYARDAQQRFPIGHGN